MVERFVRPDGRAGVESFLGKHPPKFARLRARAADRQRASGSAAAAVSADSAATAGSAPNRVELR